MKPIFWRRPYYRVLDFVYPLYVYGRPVRRYFGALWSIAWWLMVVMFKVIKWVLIASMVVGTILVLIICSFASGKNKLLNIKPKATGGGGR